MATATLSKKQWPFAPQSINNCLLWLDAADTSSYTPSASISTWRNKGYSGGNATTTSGTVGSTSAEINGSPAMTFGTNAYMTAPSMTFTQTTRTAFVVVNIGATGVSRYFLINGGSSTIDTGLVTYYSGTYTDVQMSYYFRVNYQTTAPYPVFNTTSIICGTTLSTNGGLFINGLAQTPYATNNPGTYGTGTTTTQWIGTSTNGSFVIGEIMIFDGAITDIQRQQVEGYLAQKWGLQSLLPPTHPYYTLNNLLTYAFEPTQIPTCALWLDASDATSITGTSVYQWKDKSGNGNNATASSPATYSPSSKALLFTGSQSYATTLPSLITAQSGFAVVSYNSAAVTDIISVNQTSGQAGLQQIVVGSTNSLRVTTYGGTIIVSGGTFTQNTTFLYNYSFDSTAAAYIYLNGTQVGSTTGPYTFTGAGTINIGGYNGANEGFIGSINEIILYNTVLSTTQRKAV